MKVFSTSPPSIIQPIFRTNTWHRKPFELMDNISRWRAVAADMNLSAKVLIRLEWMIFYKIVGKKMLTKQPNTLLLALRHSTSGTSDLTTVLSINWKMNPKHQLIKESGPLQLSSK